MPGGSCECGGVSEGGATLTIVKKPFFPRLNPCASCDNALM